METVSFQVHYDSQIASIKEFNDERERRYQERFAAQEEAIRVADKRLEEYKASANEWRGQSKDREDNFLSKQVFDTFIVINDDRREQMLKSVDGKISSLQSAVNQLVVAMGEMKGRKEGISATWAIVLTLLSMALGAGLITIIK